MARTLKKNERLVCVGQTALRDPDGTPLQSVPMYIIVRADDVDHETNMSIGESGLIDNITEVLAGKFRQYVNEAGLK